MLDLGGDLKDVVIASISAKRFSVEAFERDFALALLFDLIFKWATLHLDLKQASALKPLQAMLLALLNMLKEDHEVSQILPTQLRCRPS